MDPDPDAHEPVVQLVPKSAVAGTCMSVHDGGRGQNQNRCCKRTIVGLMNSCYYIHIIVIKITVNYVICTNKGIINTFIFSCSRCMAIPPTLHNFSVSVLS